MPPASISHHLLPLHSTDTTPSATKNAIFNDLNKSEVHNEHPSIDSPETRNLLQIIFEILPDAVVLVDADGHISHINNKATELFGYAQTELLGKSIEILVPTAYAEKHVHLRKKFSVAAVTRAMGLSRPTLLAQRKDGKTVPVDIALSPISMNGKNITLAVIRDMSERIAMADQLRHAQKLDALGNLSSGIAHDFNNVIAIIRTILETLKFTLNDHPGANKAIDRAIGATKIGAELTHRLLAFARKQPLTPRVLNTKTYVANVVDLLRRTLGGRIEIVETYAPEIWNCRVDPAQLENAIVNLAINARDAMPQGGKLTFRLKNIEIENDTNGALLGIAPGRYVSIEVDDTGIGMTQDTAKRVFEPFFSTKLPGKGTGLGLSMIYGFAVQSAGTARLYNKPDGGVIAQILLPMTNTPETDISVDSASTTDELNLSPPQGKSISAVLIVDDNTELCLAVMAMLSVSGLTSYAAENIDQAIRALSDHPEIETVLTDLALANGESGYDLIQRALAIRKKLRVVAMSGFADAHVPPQALVGRVRLIHKPFDQKELISTIRKAEVIHISS